ncbi:MAG: hypothetical protein ABFE01_14990 [Phycisphaerales bacterium]
MSELLGFTCVGVSLGAITGIKEINTDELSMEFDRVYKADDSNNAGTAYPIKHANGPITLRLHWNATIYAALRTMGNANAPVTDTLTITKTGEGTWAGAAYVSNVSSMAIGSDRKKEFSCTFEPETQWAYTAP